jgi:hypothetical protein
MKPFVRYVVLGAVACVFGIGCAENPKPTTQPTGVRERQDAALRDPFGYGGSTDKVDITGGDVTTFDKKAFKKDVDTVLNP